LFFPLSPAWERVRERGVIAFKSPLAFLHPLPFPLSHQRARGN